MNDKYRGGFIIKGSHPILDQEWLYQEELSNANKLVFYGYDANLCPLRNFSKRPNGNAKQKIINTTLDFTKEFSGEVWLDDVCVKKTKENDDEF